ncbi:uncharacterized protein LOC143738674 isoform X2 [Siphateles boraxobius]|uniref:uncharacterized protein LOC143738674 isoform X2 n=1 Tax=Siphateles boraxobius TaxID=180520 RepID=UPI004063656A
MNIPGKHGMDREDEKDMNIYANTHPINSFDSRAETENSESKRHQTPQHTGSDSVRNRGSRAAAVCLVLLCVLLLTAVIVLCVHIHTKSTNYTEERDQLLTNNTRLTEERDQLLTNNTRLTEERDQLLTRNMQLTKEKDGLSSDGWVYYQSSFYFISSEKKSWTESRRDCRERGADLIIINNRKEQEIVNMISGDAEVWIGLTDSDVEGTWKWVDGSTLTSGTWRSGEPNGQTSENCVLTCAPDWIDHRCHEVYRWICEKKM